MNTNELSFDELNTVAGGMMKQPTKPIIPPTTGPTPISMSRSWSVKLVSTQ